MSPIASSDLQPVVPDFPARATPTVKAELTQLSAEDTSSPTSAPSSSKKVDYASYLSVESQSRYPSPLKSLALKYLKNPGIISFGGGMPHPSTFPVNQMAFSFPYLSKNVVVEGVKPASDAPISAYDAAKVTDNQAMSINIQTALQYGGSGGAAQLLAFLKEHNRRRHTIPYDDWDVVLTNGNTDGMDNILRMLAPRGSNVLVEAFAYPGTLAGMNPQGIKPVPVKLDSEGMMPSDMDAILSSWEESQQGPKPRLVVIVPAGQNPSGTTMSLARKKEFYSVAQKHDLIILSDDPYRVLELSYDAAKDEADASSGVEKSWNPSFLSIDTDGRVLDMMTFSKVVAPGCRCGWITGPSFLIKKLILRNEVTMQAVSGFSIAALCSFLGAIGGQDGWDRYLEGVARNYSNRARIMNDAFTKHLPLDKVEWVVPAAGMFFFVRIKAEVHPSKSTLSPKAILDKVFEAAIAGGVILTPSTLFRADGNPEGASETEIFLRASFSYNEFSEIDEGARRLGAALNKVFEA